MTTWDYIHKNYAKKWIIQATLVSLVGGILNITILSAISGMLYLILSFLIFFGVLVINTRLLFRHVDGLIRERISQVEE